MTDDFGQAFQTVAGESMTFMHCRVRARGYVQGYGLMNIEQLEHRRIFFYNDWAVVLAPSFQSEIVDEGETLRLFDDHDREVSLSALTVRRNDGVPLASDDILSVFPPDDMQGIRFERCDTGLDGRALWMAGYSDLAPPCWVLMAILVGARMEKALQCTIVTPRQEDLRWAVEVWRGIVYTGSAQVPVVSAPDFVCRDEPS